ncbi:MAG: aminoacyl-tRNA hydrolase [Bacteroidales bacterium]|nr:aminoacyl-tRNA hydrolase [Bacteroidales bacterium]
MRPFKEKDFYSEMIFSASRSSGAGGQNVNKVSSRIELRFSLVHSQLLTDEEKLLIQKKLSNRINSEGELILTAQDHRSQVKNKALAIEKFFQLLAMALKQPKKRVATRPTKASRIKRLESKRMHAQKKKLRDRNSI